MKTVWGDNPEPYETNHNSLDGFNSNNLVSYGSHAMTLYGNLKGYHAFPKLDRFVGDCFIYLGCGEGDPNELFQRYKELVHMMCNHPEVVGFQTFMHVMLQGVRRESVAVWRPPFPG